MAESFSIRTSNIRVEIESATPDLKTGKVDIKFKARDYRINNFQINLAQYDIGSGYVNMSILPAEERDTYTVIDINEDIPAKAEYKSFILVWDAGTDLNLIDHTGINIKIRGEDSDGTNDDENIYGSTLSIAFLPVIVKYPTPLRFLKDTTPEFTFEAPYACRGANMHFTIVISE